MPGRNQNKCNSGISAFVFLIMCVVLFCGVLPAGAQQGVNVVLSKLQTNTKLRASDDILADFVSGESETAVIVLLQPTATAKNLASKSLLSAQVPAEFTGPGAATYYELQDESVRAQLHATVTETVNRVIGGLGATEMTVTQRFSYQFGFAAKVTPAALEQIVNSPDVVAVEKDHILHSHLAQGIPLMNASTVRSSYTGSGLSIAICDTGIDTSHPRLGGGGFPNAKVIGGYDTGDNDTDPRPDSVNGMAHGTACAGIAAGSTGTVGDYIGGVAPDAKLYAIKISTGNDGTATTSAMIAGWEWAVTHKNDDPNNPIMIISTSFGGGAFGSTCDAETPSMTTAAANAVAAGITIFASSGNDGSCGSMGWPACISYVNSVGAVYDGTLGTLGFCVDSASCATKEANSACSTGYVSWDATASDKITAYSNTASFLTLLAPSNNAYTADIVGAGGYSSGDYDSTFGGTSAACPYAAGSAALLQEAAKAKNGSYLTPAQVKTYLVNNGDSVTDSKVAVTKPRINLGRAIDSLTASSSTPTPTLTTEPAVTPGTGNTIYWSTVSSSAVIPMMVEPQLVSQAISTGLTVPGVLAPTRVSVAGTSSGNMVPFTSLVNSIQQADMSVTSNKYPQGEDHLIPTQEILRLDSVFAPQDKVEKGLSASELLVLASTSLFSETFEGDFPGSSWTLYGSPTWNDTNSSSHLGSWSGWCGGSSLSPASGYTNNMNAWMVSGPFSLTGATSASLSFWYKNLSENNFDYFKWLVSVDGVNFYGYQVSGDQNSWRNQLLDLTNVPTLGDLRGQSQVWIAFGFASDGSGSGPTYTGAYVDDIVITKETASNPDLTVYKPTNWNDKIPVGTTQLSATAAHSETGPYYDNQTLHFNFNAVNQGTATATGYKVHIEVTGTGGGSWDASGLTSDSGSGVWLSTDQAFGPLAAGAHTLKIWVDYDNTVSESNETNNYYERTITVSPSLVEYYAESANNSGFNSPINSGWTTQKQWTFSDLTSGLTYWYRVKAKRGIEESGWSNIEFSDQDPPPSSLQLSSATFSVNEDEPTVTITATRTGGSSGVVGISYATANGTAIAGSDFTAASGTLSWVNGDTANMTFTVPISNDSIYEGNETFTVTLSSPTGWATLGSQGGATVTIVDYDATPPTLILSTLPDNAVTGNDTLNITGSITDPSGIASFTVNGVDLTAQAESFSHAVQLIPGSNTLTIVAIDNFGNQLTDERHITLDITAPLLTLSMLADGARTKDAALNVSGTATDNTVLTSLLVNSEPVTVQPDGSYSTILGLLAGDNTITVTAIDIAENKTIKSRTINLDQNAPQITISTPMDNSITSQPLTVVSGTVDETAELQIINEAGDIHLPNRDGNAFAADILLSEGLNTLSINALDLAGNSGSAKRSVNYVPLLAPSISVTTPAEDTIVRDGLVTISGLVTDASSNVILSIIVGDKSYTPTVDNTGHFNQDITLPEEGIYSVQVTATDDAGNSTRVTRNILYTHGLISTNQGAEVTATTKVNLALDYQPAAVKMRFCFNDKSWTAWETYATTKSVLVPTGDGIKTIYVQFLEADGKESQIYFDSIRFDTLPPKGSISINNGATYTTSLHVTLTLILAESADDVQMQFSTNKTLWSAWEGFSTSKNWSFTDGEGVKTLYARFKDSAGKVSAMASDIIQYKVSSPAAGSAGALAINSDADSTKSLKVTLTITNPDATYTQMQFSTDSVKWVAWVAVKSSLPYTLPAGDGIKTIYVRFKSPTVTSGLYSDSILLDTKVPVGTISLNNGAVVTNSPVLNLTLNASDLSGIAEMQFSENGTLWSNLEPYQTSRSYTLPDSTLDGSKKLYVRFKDTVGNLSAAASDSITLDRVAPLGSVLINGNSATITKLTVPLTLKAAGAITMQLSLDGGSSWGNWEPYVTKKIVTLPDGDGTKTVKARFRDLAGNISADVSDSTSITTAPVPTDLIVPVSDLDGKYPITWEKVVTTGVTYTLEEATNADFTIGKRVAYTGSANTVNIPLRIKGLTYFYRVRTIKSGWASSGLEHRQQWLQGRHLTNSPYAGIVLVLRKRQI